MKITVLCVGKIKESYLREAIAEYMKRLSRYADMSVIEVEDERTPDRCSDREADIIREKEGERIARHIPDSAHVIALAIDGKSYSSESFSDHISDLTLNGKSNIVFIIGGSIGLADSILSKANEKLSFSKMTFPHQLMRVILLEQIYRAFRIIHNEPYHK